MEAKNIKILIVKKKKMMRKKNTILNLNKNHLKRVKILIQIEGQKEEERLILVVQKEENLLIQNNMKNFHLIFCQKKSLKNI